MSIEANKDLVRQFIEQIFNQNDVERIADFCIPGSMLAGGLVGQMMAMKSAFPDSHFSIESMVAEGEKVAAEMTVRGTNTGPMIGLPAFGKLDQPVPPSGKAVMHSAMYLFTIKDNRIQGIALTMDEIGMLQQLGWSITPPIPDDKS